MTEKQQWATWRQQQTLKQLEAFKQDVKSPTKVRITSRDILESQRKNAHQNSENMIKSGVLSKFAKRKLKQEQQNSGVLPEKIEAAIAKMSTTEEGKYDCFNEISWLQNEVRKLQADVLKLSTERNQLLEEKASWYSKFQEENNKWGTLIREVKIMKTKLNTEIQEFSFQRNALRTVEINATDRVLYDVCMEQLPLCSVINEITSGNERMRSIECHASLTSLMTTCRSAQAGFLDKLIEFVTDAEYMFIDHMEDRKHNNYRVISDNQQKLDTQIERIRQWVRKVNDLSLVIANTDANPEDVNLFLKGEENNANNANLDRKHYESLCQKKDRSGSVDLHRSGSGSTSASTTHSSPLKRVNTDELRDMVSDAEEEYQRTRTSSSFSVTSGGGDVFGNNNHIPFFNNVGSGSVGGSGDANSMNMENKNESAPTKPFETEATKLFVSMLSEETSKNTNFHRSLNNFVRDLVLNNPIVVSKYSSSSYTNQQHQHKLCEDVVEALHEEVVEIVAHQIKNVIMGTIADEEEEEENEGSGVGSADDDSVGSRHVRSTAEYELMAVEYLKNTLLQNEHLLDKFVSLSVKSHAVYPEVTALVALAISYFVK